MTQEFARALAEANYISVAEYLRLCEKHGWKAQQQNTAEK